MAETVYLESTIPSYLRGWPSRDVIVLAHQQITKEWWDSRLDYYDVYVSELVIQEISAGDPDAARKRLEAVERFPVLKIEPEAERLAQVYLEKIPVIADEIRDALHLAIASANGIDYLLTWNCSHIASAEVRKALEVVNDEEGISTPGLCTPEELSGGG
jgi:predicted nucleic acid-binding protein